MLYFDKIDISEEIDVNKKIKRVPYLSQLVFFLNKVFKFQTNVCNRCHDLLMMSMNLRDTAILNIKSADYCCIVSGISKNE